MNARAMRTLIWGAVAFLCLPAGLAQIRSVTRPTIQIPPVMNLFFYPGAPPRMAMGWGQPGGLTSAAGGVVAAATPSTAVVAAVPAPARSEAEQAEIQQRVVAFQRQRAEAGRPGAQYELGMSYLNATGVTRDLTEARRWLACSAGQGNEKARRALAQLDEEPVQVASTKVTPPASSGQ